MESTKETTLHRREDNDIYIYPQKYKITVELTENHIHCETTGKVLLYRDLIKKRRTSMEKLNVQRTWMPFTGTESTWFHWHHRAYITLWQAKGQEIDLCMSGLQHPTTEIRNSPNHNHIRREYSRLSWRILNSHGRYEYIWEWK